MIFRQFNVGIDGRHAYVVACERTRQAAVIDPHEGVADQVLRVIDDLDLQLTFTLETRHEPALREGALQLRAGLGARRVAPRVSQDAAQGPVDLEAKSEDGLRLGDLFVAFVEQPNGAVREIAYRIDDYLFSGLAVVIDLKRSAGASRQNEQGLAPRADEIVECVREGLGLKGVDPEAGRMRQFRQSPQPVPLVHLVMGSLREAVERRLLTPKETRVAEAYLELVGADTDRFPSAEDVASVMRDVDRTGVHVLVHNIRWKQIEARQLPMVLKGQMSKWLRGIQTEPEWTAHEREFLATYLELVERHGAPPTGPEIVAALPNDRNVQWVRKRAHTIRGKQREFNQPLLLLSREPNRPSQDASRASGTGA